MNALVFVLRNAGINQGVARRLLAGERIVLHNNTLYDEVWYRNGNMLIRSWPEIGVDDCYLIETGEYLEI